jgi:iron complex outermembrane receptor protein
MTRRASPAGPFGALPLLFLPAALGAQAEPAPVPGDTAFRLPSISVTSSRHAESPLAVPFAFTRIALPEFRSGRGYGLDEALNRIPGVLVQSRYGVSDVRLIIRGYGARGAGDRSNAGTSRGIRVILDGFPETEPDGRTSFDGIDLGATSGIEVIRSNATTLFGNAAGGVVNISTLPEFERAFGEAEVAMGGFGFQRYLARLGSTLGDDGARVAGTLVHTVSDGWRAHSDAERTLFNAGISAPLSPATTLSVYAVGTSNRFRIPGPLTQAEVDADPSQANATYASRDERRHNRVGRLGVTVEHDFAGGRAGTLAVSGYVNPKFLQRSERGTFRDFTRYHVGGNATYRASTALGSRARGGILAGVDEAYQDGAILFYSLTEAGTRGTTLRDNKREGANNLGGFLQGELGLGERWSFTLGGRYDRVTYYSQSFINPRLDDTRAFAKVTPRAAINFRLSPSHSFYANVGGGVEVPAGNETDPASTFGQDTVTSLNPLLDPIVSRSYEIGTKQIVVPTRGLLTDLSYDVALYHIRVSNDIVPYRGGRFYFTAGRTHRTGAELGLTARTRPGVFVSTAVTWSRNRYAEYVVDSVHYGRPGQTADYSGNAMVGVPQWMAHGTLGIAPNRWRGFRLQVDLQTVGRYFLDDANQVSVPGYPVFGATVALDQPARLGALSLRGYLTVNNLFDRRYIGSAFLNPDVVNGVPVAFEPGLPRSVVVGAAVGWR